MRHQYYLIPLLVLSCLTIIEFSHYAFTQQQRSVYVYTDPVPDYATSYASNVVYDATKAWEDVNPDLKFYQASSEQNADLAVQWIRDYGDKRYSLGEYVTGSKLIQVGLGDSYCLNTWEPYSTHTITHIAEHEIGHFLGRQHSSDPNDVMYPYTPIQYGVIEKQNNLAARYGWFIPACTQNNVTSFAYGVKTSDPTYGFDVYFVPTKDEFDNWSKGQGFQYYSDNGCFAKSYLSFSGTCAGITKGSGLLVIMNSQLTNSLATVTVQLMEQTPSSQYQTGGSISPQQPPQPPPTPPATPTTGFVKVNQNQYVISVEQTTQVQISGKVNNSQGGKVVLTISKPDGTSEVLQAYVTSSGDFSTPIILDKYSAIGQYQVYANYQNSDFSTTSFEVVSQNGSTQQPSSNPQSLNSINSVPQQTPSTPPQNNFPRQNISLDNISLDVMVADTMERMSQGLQSQDQLPYDQGMLFVLSTPQVLPIWMVNMKFPLDLIWFDGTGAVLHIEKAVQPCNSFDQSTCPIYDGGGQKTKYVLEVTSGFVDKYDISLNSKLVTQPVSNQPSSEKILQVEGTHFSVPYEITGGSVLGIIADTQAKLLIISVQSTSQGTFTITMPRVLIDAKNGQQDDQFFVLLNGKQLSFSEKKTQSERTLSIQFPSGTEQIEIIGTQVVPEFGSLADVIIVISIIGVIVISTKFKFIQKVGVL